MLTGRQASRMRAVDVHSRGGKGPPLGLLGSHILINDLECDVRRIREGPPAIQADHPSNAGLCWLSFSGNSGSPGCASGSQVHRPDVYTESISWPRYSLTRNRMMSATASKLGRITDNLDFGFGLPGPSRR